MLKTLKLLQKFTELIPIDGPAKHNITLSDDGKSLRLTLFIDKIWQEIGFTETGDYEKPIEEMFDEIVEVLREAGYKI